jgi:transcriptional regulator with XRE-family HTH domain
MLKTNGKWLTWARKMSNIQKIDVAKKMKVDLKTLDQWEKTGQIDHDNLIQLSNHYNRSPMMFFNVNNPSQKISIPDFRTKGSKKKELSIQIINELQKTNIKRENLLSLEDELDDYEFLVFNLNSNTKNIKELAEFVREKIGMNKALIDTLTNQDKALESWIKKVEELGVLIFQFYDIDIEEMRGYALYHDKLPIIGIKNIQMGRNSHFFMS